MLFNFINILGADDGFCKRCGSGEQPEWILLCDKCDAGYHASCLKPMLFLVPEGDWFCPPCNHVSFIIYLSVAGLRTLRITHRLFYLKYIVKVTGTYLHLLSRF